MQRSNSSNFHHKNSTLNKSRQAKESYSGSVVVALVIMMVLRLIMVAVLGVVRGGGSRVN